MSTRLHAPVSIVRPALDVEEVTARIVPARGVKLIDAIKAARPDGIVDLEVREKERDALLTIFRKKQEQAPLEFVDGILYFRCPIPKDAPSIAVNLDDGVVIGQVRTLVVFDTNAKREWVRKSFNPPLDLSPGGVLTIALD